MTDFDSLSSKYPNWDVLNAYERTKIACRELTLEGAQIPGWTDLRVIIGRGSAGDINRAKHDFRLEHAKKLQALEEIAPAGVPEELSEAILTFWQLARKHAQAAFTEKEVTLLTQAREAKDAMERAQEGELLSSQALATEQARAQGLAAAREALSSELRSERAARARAEQAVELARADAKERVDAARGQANEQITKMEAALTKAQADLTTALDRLEGAQRHSLLQIESARTETRELRADYEARLKSAQSDLTLSNSRALQTQDRLQNALRDAQQALSKSRADCAAATARLEQTASELESIRGRSRDHRARNSGRLTRRPTKRRSPLGAGPKNKLFPKRAKSPGDPDSGG